MASRLLALDCHAAQSLDFIGQILVMVLRHENQPFFAKDRDTFIPNAIANGPWIRIRTVAVVIGLLAFEIEGATV